MGAAPSLSQLYSIRIVADRPTRAADRLARFARPAGRPGVRATGRPSGSSSIHPLEPLSSAGPDARISLAMGFAFDRDGCSRTAADDSCVCSPLLGGVIDTVPARPEERCFRPS